MFGLEGRLSPFRPLNGQRFRSGRFVCILGYGRRLRTWSSCLRPGGEKRWQSIRCRRADTQKRSSHTSTSGRGRSGPSLPDRVVGGGRPQTPFARLGLMPCSAAVPAGLRRGPRASLAAPAPSPAPAPASFPARPASALLGSGDPVLCLAPECSFVLLMIGAHIYPPGIHGNRLPCQTEEAARTHQ
jgi:hypothetical protein